MAPLDIGTAASPFMHFCVGSVAAEAGADPRARDGAGRSLMDHALDTGDSAWVEWVKTHGRPSAAELMKALLRSIEVSMQGDETAQYAAVS